jgi:peroxiredoxin
MKASHVAVMAMLLGVSMCYGAAPAVGQKAPQITGEDINGKALKLSDFAGKVVVLDFFGDW